MSLRPEEQEVTSPGPPQVGWLSWGTSAFAKAQQEGKPVLLSIGAVWCYWCHVMDETTCTDPDVAHYIKQHFVPVKVDTDHRPDINARYNVGGWPSTVFLTPHGGHIAGATYLPPDQLLAMLMEVQRAYAEHKVALYDQSNSLLRQRREAVAKVVAGAEVDDRLVDRIARRAIGTYDPKHGGFGEEPKFPGISILQLLLHQFRTTSEKFYRVMLEKTLDGMTRPGIFDQEEGGFFRYSARADWSEPQYEKMLEDNIGLARVFLDASLLLDRQDYRQVAHRTIDYLLNCLYDDEADGFRGSQGAHSDYYGLSEQARQKLTAPAIDSYCYASWSAAAVSLLLEASWKLPRPDLARTALRVLHRLDSMEQAGRLAHVYNQDGPLPECGGSLLADWVHLLNALLDCHTYQPESEKYLDRAREVAASILQRYLDADNGGFFDVEGDPEAIGYLKVREKPLPENVVAVQGLLKLYHATRDEAYREAADHTLSAYVEANRMYGEFAAGYAVVVDQSLNPPVEITIEGLLESPATQAMLRAAVKLSYPHLVIKYVTAGAGPDTLAHVCLDAICLPPVSDPASLAAAVEEAASPRESPFENIFGSFI